MEFPANHHNPRTAATLRVLTDAGLVHRYRPEDRLPVSICRGSGLRTDVVRSAEKAADATGQIQVIQYTEGTVKVQDNLDDQHPTFVEVYATWVLPDATRRLAMKAKSPTVPQRVADEALAQAGAIVEKANARNTHH